MANGTICTCCENTINLSNCILCADVWVAGCTVCGVTVFTLHLANENMSSWDDFLKQMHSSRVVETVSVRKESIHSE